MQLNINLSIYFIYFSTYYSNKNYYLQTKGVTNITTSFLFFFFFIISKAFKQGNKGAETNENFNSHSSNETRQPLASLRGSVESAGRARGPSVFPASFSMRPRARRPVVVVYTSLAATCHKSTSISRGATWPSHFLFPNPSPPPRVFQQLPTLLCVIFTAS